MQVSLRTLIVRWNNENPLDKKFREKYKIAFNSPQHREINQLDILIEYIEDQVFSEYRQIIENQDIKDKQYKEGRWLEEKQLTSQESQDLFDKIDVFKINSEDSQIQIR